jgi:hypothetical protein
MSEHERDPAIAKSGAPGPAEGDSGRDHDGITGDAAMKGGEPSPDGLGEASADGPDAIDLESVRDRAS